MYGQIFHNIKPFRYAVYIMLGLVTSAAIACFFDNLFICYPVTALIEPYYFNNCIDQAAVFLSTLVINLIFDILILLMPIPVVLGLQLPTRGKIQVLGMFLLGAMYVIPAPPLFRDAVSTNRSLASSGLASHEWCSC